MSRAAGDAKAIGIVFETFDTYPSSPGAPPDAHVEYEPMSTVEVLEEAIRALGREPVRLGSPGELLRRIGQGELPPLAAALNIAEGYGSRNREAWAPVLLELAGVPCLGSDALTLSLCLDKALALRLAASAGIRVAPHVVLGSAAEAEAAALPAPFPLFVKPRWEGTAKGIRLSSLVHDRAGLAQEVARIARDYEQPALVEAFVPGAEYTVTVVGNDPPRALPVVQRALDAATRIGWHAVERERSAGDGARGHCLPGALAPVLEARLGELACRAFALFECRDFARADFRLDDAGEPVFLELNPLPTFAVDGTFGILAELEGRPLRLLLADVLASGLRRLGLAGEGDAAGRAHRGPSR